MKHRRLTVCVALMFAAACTSTPPVEDASTDATSDAGVEDSSDANQLDACMDACCLPKSTICGAGTDLDGCSQCCSDAWGGPIPKTIDYYCL